MPVGSVISGLRWRVHGGLATWPASTITFADYEITLAQAANPIPSTSTTFASNMLNPVMVRDGALSFGANSFPGGGIGPTPWGPLVQFQSSYTYAGGDLVLLVTHTGGDSSTITFLDAVDASAANGYIAYIATSFRAASGQAFQAFMVTQLEYSVPTSVPEPAAVSTFAGAVGLAAFFRLRRR
ncbi:hypothetical protein F183_A31330 [Bryobacterales bacterium F-183]|nr:hypothetical protein F183_A31330 [Bryobacterales bacterium F-183]